MVVFIGGSVLAHSPCNPMGVVIRNLGKVSRPRRFKNKEKEGFKEEEKVRGQG